MKPAILIFTFLSLSYSGFCMDRPIPLQWEIPLQKDWTSIATKKLEVADSQLKSGHYRKAMDSYIRVFEYLPQAPKYDELWTRTYESLVKALNSAPPESVIEFGIRRAKSIVSSSGMFSKGPAFDREDLAP